MSYDPDARRDTPLALKLKDLIRNDGPISVNLFAGMCMSGPGAYYIDGPPPIGRDGDFITAPEISQIYGEMVGAWCVVVWQQMGKPSSVDLCELGPGRGTLIADALRVMQRVPEFWAAMSLHLVEISHSFRARQATKVAPFAKSPKWYDSFYDIDPEQPKIVLANEFLDVCFPHFYVRHADGWSTYCVGLDDQERLQFMSGSERQTTGFDAYASAAVGAIVERHSYLPTVRPTPPSAMLFIDYGHVRPAPGFTLQAVRKHVYEHPLTSPGEADLSVQVDFSQVGTWAQNQGLAVDGPTTQAEFLGSLGIVERASRLMSANPARAGEIEAGVARLMAPNGMGTRFKAIGLRSPNLPPLPGL